jgi:hypothetical protein
MPLTNLKVNKAKPKEKPYKLSTDTPEKNQTCRKAGVTWKCGYEATETLRDWTDTKEVRCVGDEKDKFGRLIADCFVDGYNVNARLDGAKLTNANLTDATLSGAALTSLQDGVQANSSTICPNGLNLGTAGNDCPF